MTDPYLDPETGILRNLVGARTAGELATVEGDLTAVRLVQLMDHPVPASGDLDELRGIHRTLFQDVYDWAGETRIVNLRKNAAGADWFLPYDRIGVGAGYAAEQLRDDNMLRGLSRDRFIERLAHHYDQVNYLHPFREGNGRTQRVFWTRIAGDAGWQLDWRTVSGSENDRASRAAGQDGNLAPLRDLLARVVSPIAPADGRDAAWRAMELARSSFPAPVTEATRGRSGLVEDRAPRSQRSFGERARGNDVER